MLTNLSLDCRSEREEDFYQISLDVKGKGSLEKSLEAYVKVRVIAPTVINHQEQGWTCAWCDLRGNGWRAKTPTSARRSANP